VCNKEKNQREIERTYKRNGDRSSSVWGFGREKKEKTTVVVVLEREGGKWTACQVLKKERERGEATSVERREIDRIF
jgi:hypothetical protein